MIVVVLNLNCGGGSPWRPLHSIQLYYEEKCYFLLLIARVYICTHFHIKRKRHRHFLGFSFAAKLIFSKIVATGRSQVKLSSSETIRIHYCLFLHPVVGCHHKAENVATFLLMFECWVSCGKGSLNA